MTMRYAKVDTDAAKSVVMRFDFNTKLLSDPAAASLLGLDGSPFPFQFPPKITNDSKSARWRPVGGGGEGVDNPGTYDDMVIWGGSESRSIGIEASYVIDGGQWSAKRLAKLGHAAKAYLYLNLASAAKGGMIQGPVVVIESLYGAVEQKSTWRLETVSISYGERLVADSSVTSGFHPLTMKISFGLKSYTKMADNISNRKGYITFGNMALNTEALWY